MISRMGWKFLEENFRENFTFCCGVCALMARSAKRKKVVGVFVANSLIGEVVCLLRLCVAMGAPTEASFKTYLPLYHPDSRSEIFVIRGIEGLGGRLEASMARRERLLVEAVVICRRWRIDSIAILLFKRGATRLSTFWALRHVANLSVCADPAGEALVRVVASFVLDRFHLQPLWP
jgi:hypothetical protein